MNLSKLFEMQRKLDEKIVQEKGLQGQNLLDKKILALQVELGELANEWRGFKFWSENQEPRIKDYKQIKCKWCNGSGDDGTGVCPDCRLMGDVYKEYNPLLEEYVDCLHFILSIGNDLGLQDVIIDSDYTKENATETFIELFDCVSALTTDLREFAKYPKESYEILFNAFIGLGERYLDFSWQQIEQAYLEKNTENHRRQEVGY